MRIENAIFDYFQQRAAAGDELLSQVTRHGLSTLWGRYEVCKTAPARATPPPAFKSDSLLFVRPRLLKIQEIAARAYPVTTIEDIDPTALDEEALAAGRISGIPWQHDLYEILHLQGDERSHRVRRLLDEIALTLLAVRPRAVVFWNDSQYLERAVAVAAKALHIPTITVQHGLILPPERVDSYDGQIADYMLVWSDFYKRRMIESRYIAADRVYVLGYPYDLSAAALKTARQTEQQPLSLCFLGQNWEKSSEVLGTRKAEIVSRVVAACRSLDIPFHYRTHPSESPADLEGLVPPDAILPRSQSLAEAIASHSHFVSIASTALIEAGLYGKTCIQVYDPTFEFDDMQQVGATYSCPNDVDAIAAILSRVRDRSLTPMPVSPDFFLVNDDLPSKLTGILHEILERDDPGSATEMAGLSERVADGNGTGREAWCILGPSERANIEVLNWLPEDVRKAASGAAASERDGRPEITRTRALFTLFGASDGTAPVIPGFLDGDAVDDHWRRISGELIRSGGPVAVSDPAACFTLPAIRRAASAVRCLIVVTDPRSSAVRDAGSEGALRWIASLHAALSNAQGVPAACLFFDEADGNPRAELASVFARNSGETFEGAPEQSEKLPYVRERGVERQDFTVAAAVFLYDYLKLAFHGADGEVGGRAREASLVAAHTHRSVLAHLAELSTAAFGKAESADAIALQAILNSSSYRLVETLRKRLRSGPVRQWVVRLLKTASKKK